MKSSFSGFSTSYPRREGMSPRIEQTLFQGEHAAWIEAILESSFEDLIINKRTFPGNKQRFFQGEHEAWVAILKSSFEDHIDRKVIIDDMIRDVVGGIDREVVIGNEGMLSNGELKIEIDHSSLENQTNRFVMELGLSKTEAENISKDVRDLAEAKINEQDKNWSKTVREAFANLMTAILIEEIKAISPTHGNPKSLTALGTYSAVAFDRTISIENVNRLRDMLYPDRI